MDTFTPNEILDIELSGRLEGHRLADAIELIREAQEDEKEEVLTRKDLDRAIDAERRDIADDLHYFLDDLAKRVVEEKELHALRVFANNLAGD